MGESESRPIIFETPGFIIPQKKKKSETIIYFCVVFSLLPPPHTRVMQSCISFIPSLGGSSSDGGG